MKMHQNMASSFSVYRQFFSEHRRSMSNVTKISCRVHCNIYLHQVMSIFDQ